MVADSMQVSKKTGMAETGIYGSGRRLAVTRLSEVVISGFKSPRRGDLTWLDLKYRGAGGGVGAGGGNGADASARRARGAHGMRDDRDGGVSECHRT